MQDAVDCPEWVVPFHLFKLLAEEVCGYSIAQSPVMTCAFFPYFQQVDFNFLWKFIPPYFSVIIYLLFTYLLHRQMLML